MKNRVDVILYLSIPYIKKLFDNNKAYIKELILNTKDMTIKYIAIENAIEIRVTVRRDDPINAVRCLSIAYKIIDRLVTDFCNAIPDYDNLYKTFAEAKFKFEEELDKADDDYDRIMSIVENYCKRDLYSAKPFSIIEGRRSTFLYATYNSYMSFKSRRMNKVVPIKPS